MEWTIEFGGEPQDVSVTTAGAATAEGFERMNAELAGDRRFRPGMRVLLDHTELAVDDLSSNDIRRISDRYVRNAGELHSAVVALVAPKPLQFGLARMSMTLAEPAAQHIAVFYTRDEAIAWLRQLREDA